MTMLRVLRLPLSALLLAVTSVAPLAGADAPTADEWNPVVQAVASNAADAEARLSAITTRFPTWVDGWIAAARFELGRGNHAKTWELAYTALKLERGNGDAVVLAMQALTALGRTEDALKVGAPLLEVASRDRLRDGRGGWIGYHTALAHLAAKPSDLNAASEAVRKAKAHAGTTIPAEFHLLDARIAVQRGDAAQAEALLARTVASNARMWDAWYELGRVRTLLATTERAGAAKRTRLNDAVTAFNTVTTALPTDHEAWWGLAHARLELGRLDQIEGFDGTDNLRTAAASAKRATERKADFGAAWATLGEAELRQERWTEAATALEQAVRHGADTASVRGNLAVALQKTGRVDEALALGGAANAGAADLLTRGLSAHAAGHHALATASLQAAAEHVDVTSDRVLHAQVLRFLGHAWTAAAEADVLTRDEALDRAAQAYRDAGDRGDFLARRHFAAVQAPRAPRVAYDAGWTLIGWSTFSTRGWALVLGNYGASRAWANALHLLVWGLLLAVPLALWIKSFFRGGIPAEQLREPRPARPAPAPKPTTERRSRNPDSSSIRPAPRPKGEVGALTARKEREPTDAAPVSPPAPNRPTAPRPGVKRRAPLPETEEIPKPGAQPDSR